MGGAERELLQLIRMAHQRWDVAFATLDISPEAEALMHPGADVRIQPSTPFIWPEGALAEATAAAPQSSAKGMDEGGHPVGHFDVVHLSVCKGTLEILP